MNTKVVITGMGVITSNGIGVDNFWHACLKGDSIVKPIPQHWLNYSNYKSRVWSPLPDFEYSGGILDSVERKRFDPISQLSLNAANEAIKNAGFNFEQRSGKNNGYSISGVTPERIGVFLGTGIGGMHTVTASQSHHMLYRIKEHLKSLLINTPAEWSRLDEQMIIPKRFNPFSVSMIMPSASAANMAICFGARGPNNTFSAACASGTVAIGHAFNAVRSGLVDIAITGGAEFLHDDYGANFAGFDTVGALATGDGFEVNKPFDRDRNGFLFGQGGAGIIILESDQHSKAREARALAEIIGFSENCDASSIMAPDESGRGVSFMLQDLLQHSGLNSSQVDYINTHGTGTIMNDKIEADVINHIFPHRPRINSTKSLIGHTFGASGAIEAIVTVLTLLNQRTHTCRNLTNPIADLNFVTDTKKFDVKHAISQSFAFGGINASLAFSRHITT